jgi:UDP-glucuronate decarboxylase
MKSPDDVAGPVNLGNPVECTMLELAQTVIELCDSSSRIVTLPRPADDPERRKPDISLARSLLGWQPVTDLREGLARTIRYFSQPMFDARRQAGVAPAYRGESLVHSAHSSDAL